MPAYRNVAEHPIRYNLEGNNSKAAKTVQPGGVFTLDEDHAYVVGTQIAREQVKEIDLEAALSKATPEPAKTPVPKAAETKPRVAKATPEPAKTPVPKAAETATTEPEKTEPVKTEPVKE